MFRGFLFIIVALVASTANAWPVYYRPYYNYYRPYYYPTYYYWYYNPPRPSAPKLTEKQLYDRKIEGMNAKKKYEDRVKDLGLERKDKELETAKKWTELRRKEDYYRAKGYLPPKPTPKFVYNGVDYGSYSNFQKSEAYQEYLKQIELKHREEELADLEAKKREEYVNQRFMYLRQMSPLEKESLNNKNKVVMTLENDIASGKYGPAETKKLLELWKTLQR